MKARDFIASTLLLLAPCGAHAQASGDGSASGDETAGTTSVWAPADRGVFACRRAEGIPPGPHRPSFDGDPPAGKPVGSKLPCFSTLTPEERRALRRDIRQAGQELYLPRPPRHHGGPPPHRWD